MNRKAQAMLEFIMTYGWAILAVIVVIGVLFIYFRNPNMQENNIPTDYNLKCTGEKLCEKYANANLSYYQDSLTQKNEINYYCDKHLDDYTTEQFIFHVSNRNIIPEECKNATG